MIENKNINCYGENIKVFSSFKSSSINVNDIPFTIKMGTGGIPQLKILWCDKNCSSKWGWFFRNKNAYIGFADEKELIWFCLSNDSDIN